MENVLVISLFVACIAFVIYTAVDILNNKAYSQRVKTNLLGFIFLVPFFGSFVYLYLKRSYFLKRLIKVKI